MSQRPALAAQAFANIGHAYSHLFMLLFPTVVLALPAEFGLSYDDRIGLAFAGNLLFGAGALPAGLLGDRWSASGMMVAFFLGTGAASIATGLAGTPLELALGLAAIGLFASIYHPVGMAWLVRNAVNRGKALGINGIFGSLGTGGAAVVAGVLTDLISWRAAFVVPGAICLATGVALAWCVARGTVRSPEADLRPEPEASRGDAIRAFVVLSVTMVCAGLIYQATSIAMPKLFEQRLGAMLGDGILGVSLAVSAIYLISGGSQLVSGHLADRFPLKRLYILFYGLQVPFLAVAAVAAGPALLPVTLTMVMLNVMAVPVENSLLSRYSPSKWRGTAFGAKFILTLGVASLAVPLVKYSYALAGGFAVLLSILAAMAATVAVAAAWLPADRRHAVPAPGRVTPAVAATGGD